MDITLFTYDSQLVFLVNFKGENSPKDASCKNHKYINHAKVPSFKKIVGIDPLISLVRMF